jgi:uncharacterized protein (TIGR03435 family)
MLRAITLLAVSGSAFAQASFEVASVKPAAPRPAPDNGSSRKAITATGLRDDSDPGRISLHSVTFRVLLARAYGVHSTKVTGPGWIETELYDVDAKLPTGALRSETPAMSQNLLRARFRLQSHLGRTETTELPLASGARRAQADSLPRPNGRRRNGEGAYVRNGSR